MLYEFGEFKNAASFALSDAGFIYLVDSEANEITKLDTLGKVVLTIGGFGSGSETFDEPSDIYATTLNIYVCDKNNDRIVFLDKDLNYLSQLGPDFKDSESFSYPEAAAISPQGDLFVLDSDNQRILKYDLNGKFLTQIGNYDSGEFYLNNPLDFVTTNRGDIVVLDENKILVYDQYGNGLKLFSAPSGAHSLNYSGNPLLIITPDSVYYTELYSPAPKINSVNLTDAGSDIRDAAISKNKIFVLTKSDIKVYSLK
jgi:hypothetical protein